MPTSSNRGKICIKNCGFDPRDYREVVQVRLEDFKSMLLRQLAWQVRQAAQVTPPAPADARPSLYLMAGFE